MNFEAQVSIHCFSSNGSQRDRWDCDLSIIEYDMRRTWEDLKIYEVLQRAQEDSQRQRQHQRGRSSSSRSLWVLHIVMYAERSASLDGAEWCSEKAVRE